MLNIPIINEQGRVFKSQFYYIAYKQAGIPEEAADKVLCVSRYHKEPISESKYNEISESKALLDYPDWGQVDMACILPVNREEYTLRGRILQSEETVQLSLMQRFLINAPTLQSSLWTITFAFLISMLIGIYLFDMFALGFNLKVAISMGIMLVVCVVITLMYSLTQIYFAMKFVQKYLNDRDHQLEAVGHICWVAWDTGHLSTETFLETVSALDGDDEKALFVEAASYTTNFLKPAKGEGLTVKSPF